MIQDHISLVKTQITWVVQLIVLRFKYRHITFMIVESDHSHLLVVNTLMFQTVVGELNDKRMIGEKIEALGADLLVRKSKLLQAKHTLHHLARKGGNTGREEFES